MKLKELRAGMRVELRNGEQGLIVKNGGGHRYILRDTAVSVGMKLDDGEWSEDLLCKKTDYLFVKREAYDIMKVWPVMMGINGCDLSDRINYLPYWEREEVKEVTEEEAMAALEDYYGVKVKVVRSDT